MPTAWLALLVALPLQQLPSARLGEPGQEATLTADAAELDGNERLLRGEGSVVLSSGELRLRSDLLTYDLDAKEIEAAGHILFVDGNVVIVADEGRFSLAGDHPLTARNVTLLQKSGVTPGQLLEAKDEAAARALGKNTLTLRAGLLERVGKDHYDAGDLSFTPCDCRDSAPDWTLKATSADIEPGERALLRAPVVYIRNVPVLILPALYLPLSNRRSGLLFPRPSFTRQSGFRIDQPLFLTLGESYDLTFTAGYRFGRGEPTLPFFYERPTFAGPPPTPPTQGVSTTVPARLGPKGPSLGTEFRYVPSTTSQGRLFVAGLYDLQRDIVTRPLVDPVSGATVPVPVYEEDPRGLRGELSWRHRTELASGVGARADVSLVSDANYLSDAAVDVIRDAPPYLRSTGDVFWHTPNTVLFGAAQWYQDLAANVSQSRALFGPEAPAVTQRLPVVGLLLPRTLVVGPLSAGLEAFAEHYQPVAPFGTIARPGADEPLTRIDVNPYVAAPLVRSGPLRLSFEGGARADVDSGLGGEGARPRLGGIASLDASTELSRVFGSGAEALRHTVAPRLALRATSPFYGPVRQGPVYDEFDRPSPQGGAVQAVASVVNRLTARSGNTAAELARLELGQDVDVLGQKLADAFAQIDVNRRFVALTAVGRFDVAQRQADYGSLTGRFYDARGDAVYASYERLLRTGTDRMRAGIDELFSPLDKPCEGCVADQLSCGATAVIMKGLSLRYGATIHPRARRLLQHTGGVSFGTTCDCLRVDIYFAQVPGSTPTFGFLLDLNSLGSVGGGA